MRKLDTAATDAARVRAMIAAVEEIRAALHAHPDADAILCGVDYHDRLLGTYRIWGPEGPADVIRVADMAPDHCYVCDSRAWKRTDGGRSE